MTSTLFFSVQVVAMVMKCIPPLTVLASIFLPQKILVYTGSKEWLFTSLGPRLFFFYYPVLVIYYVGYYVTQIDMQHNNISLSLSLSDRQL